LLLDRLEVTFGRMAFEHHDTAPVALLVKVAQWKATLLGLNARSAMRGGLSSTRWNNDRSRPIASIGVECIVDRRRREKQSVLASHMLGRTSGAGHGHEGSIDQALATSTILHVPPSRRVSPGLGV
jgi:hypothetical protein